MRSFSTRPILLLILVLVFWITSQVVFAASFIQDQKLTSADFTLDSPSNLPDAQYGDSVAIAGNWMAVGVPGANGGRGLVNLYQRSGGAWVLRPALAAFNQPGAGFGSSVDIYESGGMVTVIAGAPYFDGGAQDEGRAAIFVGDGIAFAVPTLIVPATPEANGRFGHAVALFGDLAAISEPNDGVTDSGLVSIRGRNTGGVGAWGQLQAKTGALGSGFGTSVDVHGEYVIVGAPYANTAGGSTGEATIYRQDAGGPNAFGVLHTLSPSIAQSDMAFGFSVGVWDSNTGAASSAVRSIAGAPLYDSGVEADAGYADIFHDSVSVFALVPPPVPGAAGDGVGFSVAIEGNESLAGSPGFGVGSTGSVTALTFGASWSISGLNLTSADVLAGDNTGWSVDVSGLLGAAGAPHDREDEIVIPPGAPGAGSVLALAKGGPTWAPESELIALFDQPNTDPDQFFGFSVAATDTWMAVGASRDSQKGLTAGAVYMYQKLGGIWTPHSKLTALYGSAGDNFGSSVALYGTKLVVGAPGFDGFPTSVNNSGAIYLFDFNGTAWVQTIERSSPNPEADGFFGYSADFDGDVVAIGAIGENGGGRIYAFRALADLSSPLAIDIPGLGANDRAGESVSVYDPSSGTPNDEVIAVGAPFGNANQGAAYVLSGATFATVTTLVDPAPAGNRFFGIDVSISNGRVAVGGPTASPAPSGIVYVFSGAGYSTVDTILPTGTPGQFGYSVDLTDTSLLVGAPATNGRAGAAHVFSRSGAVWSEQGILAPADLAVFDEFGFFAAHVDGGYAVGAPIQDANGIIDSGAVYLFSLAPEVTATPETLSVSETGPTADSFVVSLNQAPPTNVTIELTFDSANILVDAGSGYGVSPQTVTLTPANATTGVTVSVQAVDDDLDEADPHSVVITTGATSSSTPRFDGLAVADVTVNIADNDTAGVTVVESDGSTAVAEGGAADSYTVVLNTEPASPVTLNLAFDAAQIVVNADSDGAYSFVFDSSNWDTPHVLNVAAVDDSVLELDPHTTLITQTFSTSDPNYTPVDPADVTVTIDENDTQDISFSLASSSVGEAAGAHVVNTVLTIEANGVPGGTLPSDMTANVTLTLGSAEAGDFTQVTTQVTFPSGTPHNSTMPVNFTIDNDMLLEGNETFTLGLTLVTATGTVSGTHEVTITDDETGTIAFNAPAGGAPEASGTYSAPMTLTIAGTGTGDPRLETALSVAIDDTPDTAGSPVDYAVATPSVTFAAGVDSPIGSSADVSFVSDTLVEGDETFTLSIGTVSGPASAGIPSSHVVTIADDDSATVAFIGSSGTVAEGDGTYTAQVVLDLTTTGTGTPGLQVPAVVSIDTTGSTASFGPDYSFAPIVVFAPGDTDGTTKDIVISIVQDSIDEDDETISLLLVPPAPVTAVAPDTHVVTITDDDTASVIVTESGTTDVIEGGATDSYTVSLATTPTGVVTVTLTFDPTQVSLNGDIDGALALIFPPFTSPSPQLVTVTAVNDTVVEGAHTTLIDQATTSGDPKYDNAATADVTVNIADNDTAEVIFSSAGFTAIESAVFSPGATLKITANGAPGGTIGVPVTVQAVLTLGTAEAGDVTLTTATSTFPAGSVHDTVDTSISVSIANDLLVELDETFNLALSVQSGPATTTASNDYTILSDDVGQITFQSPSGTAPEATTPYTANALLTVSGTGIGTAAVEDPFEFSVIQTPGTAVTPADYTLTTTGPVAVGSGSPDGATFPIDVAIVNDNLIEGPQTFDLGFSSVTPGAHASASGTHTVTITDDDFAGVNIVETDGNTEVTEGIGSDTFTITLTAQPTSDVTITFDVGTQVTFVPNPLVIAPADWNTPQVVTVTAVDDVAIEGPHSATVGLSFTGDTDFEAITPNSISVGVDITDNDVPGVTITESDGSTDVAEGGATDTYTVVLLGAPTSDVTITLDGGAQLTTDAPSLTFTTGDFNIPQTVIVTAVDDAIYEGAHTGTVTHTVTSADANYNGFPAGSVTANIADGISQVLSNGGFEIQGANKKQALDWKGSQLTANDKRVCNKPSKPPFAFEDECAFQFKFNGPLFVNRSLKQVLKVPVWGLPGETLTFTAYFDAQSLTNGAKLRLKLTYDDSTSEKVQVAIPSGTYAYAPVATSHVLPKRVTKAIAMFKIGSETGRLWIDAAELTVTPAGPRGNTRLDGGALPVPDAAPLPLPMRRPGN